MIRVFHSNVDWSQGILPTVENLHLVAEVRTHELLKAIERTQHPKGGSWCIKYPDVVCKTPFSRSSEYGDVIEHHGDFFMFKSEFSPRFQNLDKDYYAPLLDSIRREVLKEKLMGEGLLETDSYKMPVAGSGFQFDTDIFSKE